MRRRLMAVDERDDVRVIQTLENVDFGREVFSQLLVELRQVDRFDGDVSARFLNTKTESISTALLLVKPHRVAREPTVCTPW